MVACPAWWVNSRYGLFIDAVGVRKGRANTSVYTWVGLAVAVGAVLVLWHTVPPRSGPPFHPSKATPYLDFLLLPISIGGFLMVVWAPISEEILFRGFLFGYLRTKIGVPIGLVVQALLFALMHTSAYNYSGNIGGGLFALFQLFLLGIFCGFLYQRTSTLHPSIICHAAYNYLLMVANYFWMTK